MNDKLFITGCDANTEWMLPWFVDKFKKHNPTADLLIWDFGMQTSQFAEMRKSHRSQDRGWHKKPSALIKSLAFGRKICWLDTDCEVRANLDGIFDHIVPNKLTIAEDIPWMTRRGGQWFNTGVVVFQEKTQLLESWASEVAIRPHPEGDQSNLHLLLTDPLTSIVHINPLPREYNTLRLDLLDRSQPKRIKIMHWTGAKGKQAIRELING